MSWQDLENMPILDLCNKKAYILMWATCPLLNKQVDVMESWGVHYRGVAKIWIKTRKDGGIISGQGVPATFSKPTTELLLVGTTCKTGRPYPILDHAAAQVVLAPREEHSKKPDIFADQIVQVCGDRPRIELFARDKKAGWDASGLELNGLDYTKGDLVGSQN